MSGLCAFPLHTNLGPGGGLQCAGQGCDSFRAVWKATLRILQRDPEIPQGLRQAAGSRNHSASCGDLLHCIEFRACRRAKTDPRRFMA